MSHRRTLGITETILAIALAAIIVGLETIIAPVKYPAARAGSSRSDGVSISASSAGVVTTVVGWSGRSFSVSRTARGGVNGALLLREVRPYLFAAAAARRNSWMAPLPGEARANLWFQAPDLVHSVSRQRSEPKGQGERMVSEMSPAGSEPPGS